jgi:hypothetical protein
MPIKRPDVTLPDEYRQLAFDLDVLSEDAEAEAFSADEARRVSEQARAAFEAKYGPGVGWYEDYLRLRAGGWPWRQAAYIAWASSPKVNRQPRTMDELAREHLGLTSDRAISTWRRRNPLIDEMVAQLQAAPLWEHRAEIYRALLAVAVRPEYKSHNDRKLALELLGDYVPASKLVAEMRKRVKGDLSELSEDELAVLARALQDEEGEG